MNLTPLYPEVRQTYGSDAETLLTKIQERGREGFRISSARFWSSPAAQALKQADLIIYQEVQRGDCLLLRLNIPIIEERLGKLQ